MVVLLLTYETSGTRPWLILANVSLGIFMSTLDGSIVNVALPVMASGFRVDLADIQWVVTAYLLTISSLLLIWGRLADLFGRRYLYAAGFVVFSIGSLVSAIAASLAGLVAARVLQAAGASMLMANGQAVVTAAFPPRERGRALGITGTVVALGSLTGPGLGGVLTHLFGWPSIFWINVPLGLIGTGLSLALIPDEVGGREEAEAGGVGRAGRVFDFAGAALFVVAVVALFFAMLSWPRNVYSSDALAVLAGAGVMLLGAFWVVERRAASPLLRLEIFRRPAFSLGITTGFLSFVAMSSIGILIPFYLQQLRGLSPAAAGVVMMASPAAMAVVAPLSGWLSDHAGYRWLTMAGLTVTTGASLLLAFLGESSGFVGIALRIGLVGVGMAMFQSPNNSSIMGAVARTELGVAASVNALVRNLGMITGIALGVALFSFGLARGRAAGLALDAAFMGSFRDALLVTAAVAAVAMLVAGFRATTRPGEAVGFRKERS